MSKKIQNEYNDSSIQVLEGLEAVRKRPGMYIGSTDSRGLHHLVYEIVDNAVDEILAGYGNEIQVQLHPDHSVTVRDFGRGMPTGMHPSGKSTIEVIFTVLHAGGKFNDTGAYKSSGGLHGVGASVVNALSSFLEVTVVREGKKYYQAFKDGGKPIQELTCQGKCEEPNGTTVHFLPDDKIFSTTHFSFDTLAQRLREAAFLLKGVTIQIEDQTPGKEQIERFCYEEGIKQFVEYLNEEKQTISPILDFSVAEEGIEVDCALQYNDGYNEQVLSFVNNVRTKDGGTHEAGMKGALTKAINEYAKRSGLLKEKDKKLEGTDVREGLTAIISVRIPEALLQFEGQTKGKLGTPIARTIVDRLLSTELMYYFQENSSIAQTIIQKAIRARDARESARKAREESRNGKKKKGKETSLSGKLTPAQGKDTTKNELYLVEGDSAGGSAKLGRDRKFQAILPLRGKVINTEKAKLADILKNEEINTMIYTIGAGVGNDFNVEESNYDKVIIMTDADTDGAHIQILLLTFFYRYMRPLLEAGKVYIALPPLYKVEWTVKKEKKIAYAWTEEELKEVIGTKKNYHLQRYKGLGEMNAEQLWETTMDPETRTLIRVKIEDAVLAEKQVVTLMGDKVEKRREWIEKNVSFTLDDQQGDLD